MTDRIAHIVVCGALALGFAAPLEAQQSAPGLTLEAARAAARRVSPDLAAARAAVVAAQARSRQASALANPILSYGYEATSTGGLRNSQSIAALDQALEFTGVRGARHDAARLRAEAAEADLRAAESRLAFEVTRAYAMAQAADERRALAAGAVAAFDRAQRVTAARLAAGDASGYEARRIRLEAARYAALGAEAVLDHRTARIALATLVGLPADSLVLAGPSPAETAPTAPAALTRDSVLTLALKRRPELSGAERLVAAAVADTRAAVRARIPVPVATAGWKTESVASGGARLGGFVAGISLPLPLWDRQAGAVAAADADAGRRSAEADAVRRRIAREAEEAYIALRSAEEQVVLLGPPLGEAAAALRAAENAYVEGEIPLVEWLDAVRATYEAQSTFATLRAEVRVRRAALERATGHHLFEDREP